MLTCENCGTSFEQPESLTEVTSLRVLCPKCTAERAAAKARKAGPSAAPLTARPAPSAPAKAAPSKPAAAPAPRAAPPVPARKLESAPRPAPTSAPTASAAPKLPARPVASATKNDAHSNDVAAKAPSAAPSRLAGRAAPSAPERPAKAAAKSAAKAKKMQADSEEIRRGLKKKGSREMIFAFIGAFVVFVVAGVVLWKVLGQKQAEKDAADAYAAKVEEFKTKLTGFELTSEDSAKALIAFVDEQKPFWSTLEDYSAEVVSREAKAKSYLEGLVQRRDLEQRATDIEAILAKAAELPPIELAEQRRRLDELATRAEIVGPEFVARIAKNRAEADKVYEERLMAAAETAAAATTLDRGALTTIQQSEDEIFNLLNITAKAWQKNTGDADLTAKKKNYEEKLKAVIKLSDEAGERFFTKEVIEATPWRDLLADDQVGQWKAAAIKGFEHVISGGTLHLVGPDPSEKAEGIMTVGDKEAWRDFEVDMEFTIVKGKFATYYRVPLVWQDNVFNTDLTTDEGQLEVGKTYSYSFRILGSTFVEQQFVDGEAMEPRTDPVSWVKPRKGAFGIGIEKDAEVKFTRLRARVLR